jgi:translocation and assembly module TamB
VTIDSSPIDLGVVQGLTTDLTDVAGVLEAHVRLTGAANDPQPAGAVSVRDGAMTVAPTGVRYTNIAGRVELQPDRVHIDQIALLDNHHAALSLTGDLALRERQVGDVHLYVTAEDFKVLDNKLGNVRIQSALEINGELRAPRLEGYLGLTTGRIDLDEVIAAIGTTPYSTKPTEFVTEAPANQAQVEPSGVFDALKMNLQLNVPNDFVIRSTNLQTPDAPIGLGALNVTLGGDLRALKEPRGPLQMYGSVNTVRGTYDFQGRRFDILRDGTVRFDGTNVFDPVLNVRTERVISGVEAHVNVRGTLRKPEIELSSVPPLENADILALIVFNQPINQLATGQQISLAQRAQALAIGTVAGQIVQSIGSALNLDTFELQLAPEPGQTAQLTIGQQVGKDLYVKVQQGVGELSTTNFVLEYELTRWLRLRTNVLQGSTQQSLYRGVQDSGLDLIFFFSY